VLKNMVRSGELVRVGRVPVDGYPRPLGVYAPARRTVGTQTLDEVQRALVAMVRRAAQEHAEAAAE
jgi:predicted solute-binding protein